MAEPFGVDLFWSFGGLASGVKHDTACKIVSGLVDPIEFNFGLKDVGGLNGGQERLKGDDGIVL